MTIGAPSRPPSAESAVGAWDRHGTSRRLGWILVGVCAAVTLLHVAVADLGRGLSWDEAIYVSQIRPDVQAIEFSAQRARGITLVIAPPAALGLDAVLVRAWLSVLGGAALWAAFFPWIRTIGAAAPLAAVGYATTWFALLSQSEIYPNALTALGVVAATGWALRAVDIGGGRRELVALAVAVAFTALMRPTDAVVACAAIAIGLLVRRPRVWPGVVGALLVGGLVGTAPWIVESFVRFGGVMARLELLQGAISGGEEGGTVWLQYLDLLDGPAQGPLEDPQVSLLALAWVATVAVLVAAGWVTARSRGRLRLAATTTLVAAAMTAVYLVGTPYTYLRFLLPAWAVLCPLMAVGALGVLEAGVRASRRSVALRAVAGAVLLALVAGWLAAQVLLTSRTAARLADSRASSEVIGQLIEDRSGGESCAVASQYGWPQIVFYAGCDGARLPLDGEVPFAEDDAYRHVYATSRAEPPADSVLHDWQAEPLRGEAVDGWTLYTRPRAGS